VSSQDQAARRAPARTHGAIAALANVPPAKPAPGFWGRFCSVVRSARRAWLYRARDVRWDEWTGSAATQTTNDAYVRADLTRLSSRVAARS